MFIKNFEIVNIYRNDHGHVRQIYVRSPELPEPDPETYFRRTRDALFLLTRDGETLLINNEPVFLCSFTLRKKIRSK